MDYKNKHKEEIVRATQLWECGDITRENLEYIFPELAESEDEKIRKTIIRFFKDQYSNETEMYDGSVTVGKAIAWLEKQENKKSFGLNEEKKIKNVIRGWIYTLPASFFDNGISKEEILTWLEKQGDKDKLIQELGEYKVKYTQEVLEKHLKTINKDDERLRKTTIAFLKDFAEQGYENAVECIDWLEKQVDHNKWKPSKDEMDALYGLAYITNKMDDKKDEAITKLYQDLKREFFNGASYENMFLSSPVDSDINVEKQGEQEEPQVYETKDSEIITYSENKGYKVIESKFHEGDWITNGQLTCKVLNITSKSYELHLYNDDNCHFETDIQSVDKDYHLWTVSDAKNGDVLAYVTDEEDLWIMIYWSLYEPYEGHVHYHALLVNDSFSDKGTCCICIDDLKPATKEQHDLLFSKMKEADYEFNFEKKELKEIETPEESLCISPDEYSKVVNECWYRTKSKWSEEDDAYKLFTISAVEDYYDRTNPLQKELVNWLKSLKDRVQIKQEWSEEDKIRLGRICKALWKNRKGDTDEIYQQEQDIDWLKFLKPGSCWKPNKDQIIALRWVLNNIPYNKYKEEISGLLDQIKVL